jgi:hypothetical protein
MPGMPPPVGRNALVNELCGVSPFRRTTGRCSVSPHCDVVRESVDGATFHPLMAAVEGWPDSPWLTPWRPTDELAEPIQS